MPLGHRPFCALCFQLFQVVTRDDKKEHSEQLKAPRARNQVHEMLSFVF